MGEQVGDIIYYGTQPVLVTRVFNYIWINCFGSVGFSLDAYYEDEGYFVPVDCGGSCNAGNDTRGGGARDVGYESKFVMRGTLPSPLANPVPEPSTIALFALGVLGLSLRRKKCA